MNVILDTGALGKLTHPRAKENRRITEEVTRLLDLGTVVFVPEIADYELRRELIRANKLDGLQTLDRLDSYLEYLPLTTRTMRRAAGLWAEIRRRGRPSAPDPALDGDVILAAQALEVGAEVWTTNVKHLRDLVQTRNIDDL